MPFTRFAIGEDPGAIAANSFQPIDVPMFFVTGLLGQGNIDFQHLALSVLEQSHGKKPVFVYDDPRLTPNGEQDQKNWNLDEEADALIEAMNKERGQGSTHPYEFVVYSYGAVLIERVIQKLNELTPDIDVYVYVIDGPCLENTRNHFKTNMESATQDVINVVSYVARMAQLSNYEFSQQEKSLVLQKQKTFITTYEDALNYTHIDPLKIILFHIRSYMDELYKIILNKNEIDSDHEFHLLFKIVEQQISNLLSEEKHVKPAKIRAIGALITHATEGKYHAGHSWSKRTATFTLHPDTALFSDSTAEEAGLSTSPTLPNTAENNLSSKKNKPNTILHVPHEQLLSDAIAPFLATTINSFFEHAIDEEYLALHHLRNMYLGMSDNNTNFIKAASLKHAAATLLEQMSGNNTVVETLLTIANKMMPSKGKGYSPVSSGENSSEENSDEEPEQQSTPDSPKFSGASNGSSFFQPKEKPQAPITTTLPVPINAKRGNEKFSAM